MPPSHTCFQQLQKRLPPDEYDSKIKPLRAQPMGKRLLLYAPNAYLRDEVRRRYLPHIKENGGFESVEVRVGEPPVPSAPKGPKRSDSTSRQPWPRNKLNPSFTFGSFVPGSCNRVALAAASRVAEKPGGNNGLLVLHGSQGLGKTHLMHAIGHCIHEREGDRLRVVSRRTQQFRKDMVGAFQQRGGAVEKLLLLYQSADVLLFDDIQFICGARQTQEEFLNIFNALSDGNRQIVLTCDCHPNEIRDLESGLKSRIAGGLSVAVKPPDRKTCLAILKRGLEREQVSLAPGVAEHLAQKANSDVRKLKGALDCVIQMARFMGVKTATMDLAIDALSGIEPRNQRVGIEDILCAVAEYYKVKRSDIMSDRRPQHLVRARHMAMYLARELTNRSYPDIGQTFGRDHSTVNSACKKVAERKGTDPDLEAEYRSLVRDIRG